MRGRPSVALSGLVVLSMPIWKRQPPGSHLCGLCCVAFLAGEGRTWFDVDGRRGKLSGSALRKAARSVGLELSAGMTPRASDFIRGWGVARVRWGRGWPDDRGGHYLAFLDGVLYDPGIPEWRPSLVAEGRITTVYLLDPVRNRARSEHSDQQEGHGQDVTTGGILPEKTGPDVGEHPDTSARCAVHTEDSVQGAFSGPEVKS